MKTFSLWFANRPTYDIEYSNRKLQCILCCKTEIHPVWMNKYGDQGDKQETEFDIASKTLLLSSFFLHCLRPLILYLLDSLIEHRLLPIQHQVLPFQHYRLLSLELFDHFRRFKFLLIFSHWQFFANLKKSNTEAMKPEKKRNTEVRVAWKKRRTKVR